MARRKVAVEEVIQPGWVALGATYVGVGRKYDAHAEHPALASLYGKWEMVEHLFDDDEGDRFYICAPEYFPMTARNARGLLLSHQYRLMDQKLAREYARMC